MQLLQTSMLFCLTGQLLTFCCPGTSSDSSPAVCQIRFSIVSLQYRLLSFCYVKDDMESRSQGQSSAKHNGTMRAHPDNRKMKAKKNFPRFARRDHHYKPLYTAIGSGRTTPKYLAPALLTPSHPHTITPSSLIPSPLIPSPLSQIQQLLYLMQSGVLTTIQLRV